MASLSWLTGLWRVSTLWRRIKLWVRNQVIRVVWRLVRTRLYRSLRAIISASLVPLGSIASGICIGIGVASSAGFALGYGALIGAAGGLLVLVTWKLAQTVVHRVEFLNASRRRIIFQREEQTSHSSRSSQFSRSSQSSRSSSQNRRQQARVF